MDSIELFSTHQFDSFWRCQGLDDLIAGKIYLSPQEIKLVLSGPAGKIEPLYRYISERDGPLTGYTLKGFKLSLVDAFASGHQANPPHFASVNVFANFCVVGRHLAKDEDPIPGELRLSFPFLIEWFRHNPYQSRIPDFPEIRKVDTLLDAELPQNRSRIRSFHSIRWTAKSYWGHSSDVRAFLCFGPDECNTAQKAVQRAFSCTGLWTVLCGAHVAPSCIFFQEMVEGEQPRFRRTHVFVPLGELAYPDNLHSGDVLLPFETIKDRIGMVVDNWLSAQQPPPYAVNLFLRAFRQHRRSRFDREVFQNLVTALEALADAEHIGAPLTNRDAAEELRNRLEEVIEQFIAEQYVPEVDAKDVKESLQRRVNQINQGTLKQKLAGFLRVLPPDACKRFVVLEEPFLRKVVEARNLHAHGRGRSKPSLTFNNEELSQATDQLQLLVLLLLLRAVGVEADMVMTRMLMRRDFGQIFERSLKNP